MTNTKKSDSKTCTCDHPHDKHNDMGCAVPLWNHGDPNGLNDTGERDYCRCKFQVHHDLDFGYPPVNSEGSRIEAGYDQKEGY